MLVLRYSALSSSRSSTSPHTSDKPRVYSRAAWWGRRITAIVFLVLAATLILTGCDAAVDVPGDDPGTHTSDLEIEPTVQGAQAIAVDLSSAVSVAPDGRLYGCVLSAHPEGDITRLYQYRYAQLAFPETAVVQSREIQQFTYRLRDSHGRVLRQATCLIPASTAARDLVLDWVRPAESGDQFARESDHGPTPILYGNNGPVECHHDLGDPMECSLDEAYVDADAIDDGGGGEGEWWDPIPPDGWNPDAPWEDEPLGGGSPDDDESEEDESDCADSTDDGASGGDDTNPPPPTGGDDPCGAGCYDPPTDDGTGGGGNDGPQDAPAFMGGSTWQVVTSSGLIAAPYNPAGYTLLNAGCDPEPPCESDDPPEYCDEAGSCFDAEIGNEKHRALLEAAESQEVLSTLAEDSNWDSSWQGSRRERVGVVRPLGDGFNAYPLPEAAYARESTPVNAYTYSGMIPDDAVAHIHTHPFTAGELIEWRGYNEPYDGDVSEDDFDTLESEGIETGIVIDRSEIVFYGADSPPQGDARYERCGY